LTSVVPVKMLTAATASVLLAMLTWMAVEFETPSLGGL